MLFSNGVCSEDIRLNIPPPKYFDDNHDV